MNDATGKGSSCLAIAEKKNQRVGGCIGVFFQLFDWNRSLTKKKLFKKLPPPAVSAGAKQASSKKFKGDEKMPNSKLHLIANENNGGFPSAKKDVNRVIEAEQKQEVRVPGLVARLMGLESIPASRRDRSKKSCSSDCNEEKESLDNHSRERVDLELGVGSAKHDSRPQKLQKTGTDEKRTMTRFGAEALQIKSVLSQVRKYNQHHHHHHTLKSPRVPSGKSASRRSRLIGAATKILEPGMQATNRGKHSLTSSTSISSPNPLMGHKSCKNCGNLLDVVEINSPIVSDVFIPSHENDVVLLRSQEKIITLVDEDGKNNAQSCNESFTRRMPVPEKRDLSRQLFGAQEDDDVSFAFKLKTQTQEQVLSSEKVSSGSIISNMQEKRVLSAGSTKDFVALNRSLIGRSRIRSPTKMDSCKFDLERKPSNKHDDSLPPISTLERKRRTSTVPRVDAINSGNLVTVKQKYVSSDTRGGKRRSFDASFRNNYNVKSIQGGQLNTDKINGNKVNEAVSYTFSSPSKTKIVIPAAKEERKSNNEVKTDFQRLSPSTVDALGAILEQKLKELSCQENQELATCRPPKNSTAMILQELISVLNLKHVTCSDDHAFSDKYEASHVRLLGTSCNGNHLSPGSVLEPSFSFSSLGEGSAHGFHSDNQLEQLEHGAELLYSAISFDKGRMIGYEILTELANQIHRMLQSLKSCGIRLTESNLIHMKEVIFNAELVLGNSTEHGEDGMSQQLLISCFLLGELDTMASDAMWRDFNGFAGFEESKDRSQIKGLLFDCVIEYLESNCCCQHYNRVFQAWTKLPLCKKAKMLAQEVKSEVKKWSSIAGMLPDQVIEWEMMSHSLGKWTDFTTEAFEVGVDIGGFVLQILVDEIVEELLDSWRGHILKNLPKSCY